MTERPDWDTVCEGDYSDVLTSCCGAHLQWDGTDYRCPDCGRHISRAEAFSYFGGAYGPECELCDEMFPWCIECLYGHEGYHVYSFD